MRVAFVSMETTHHGETPARRRTRRTARLLADRGHDVTVLSAKWWEGGFREFDDEGITYRGIVDRPSRRAFASKLPFALQRLDPEVVQAVVTPPLGAAAAAVACRVKRRPLLLDWWDVDPGAGGPYKRAIRGANRVLTPSRTVKTQVRQRGANGSDVRVVPESVDYSLVRSAGVDDRFDVVYSRPLDADANVETLLLALAELRRRDWRVAVVGDGPARVDAEEAAADLRIDDRVEFLGSLPIEKRVEIFKGTHVFAQTARYEPFAHDLLWALACGCVGLVEYQADSSAHELVEGRERSTLVTSPQELADEIVAAGRLERRSVDDRFEEYDRRAVLEQYLDCYRDEIEAYGLF
ncbi:Glycosyltransferase [Halalkaliarchaeum sp. AArc-CO]|uniref:glycosyltransferase n=1 Tax=unclassified Halalkaliarchaeum TaxID=2678344 RepID=UPI00217E96D6|nr:MULTISPECIES: glycosyltransferase [unclassified Halalkaliarchaeum]MDR5672128.1 glycosyltransferase [Halalkaliarchaeum sp. AArc-GB]UWG51633.1 Glycosyltransferase [Halalkaliarchaeum sp. AArc-CO]